jgi:hypothetical protein
MARQHGLPDTAYDAVNQLYALYGNDLERLLADAQKYYPYSPQQGEGIDFLHN